MNGLTKEEKDELMDSVHYRECDIIYKNRMYHIEPVCRSMSIGLYEKGNESIEKWIEINEGDGERSYQKFLNEPLFEGKSFLQILDELEIYSMR